MANPIIVTGCDAAHYDLVTDLLTSLDDVGRAGLTIGFVHVGDDAVPDAIQSRVDRMVHLSLADSDPNLRHGFPLSHLMVKARIPEFFPGHDTYIWLDGDTWVQNRAGLDQLVHCAQLADCCAHPELDPNYFRLQAPSKWLMTLYQLYYGSADAISHVTQPMFNSGVFGARASSPLWAGWKETLAEARPKVLAAGDAVYSDQVPMHRLVATGRLDIHPLRAVNNWLVHAAQPAVDFVRKRLVAPTYPHEEINIVHMTVGTKFATFKLAGGEREISYRYGAIKALFAETP